MELRKHYDSYPSMTLKNKLSIAASLGLSMRSLSQWMYKESKRQKRMQEKVSTFKSSLKQEQTVNSTSMYTLYMQGTHILVYDILTLY